jgi:hypothetical protein
MLRAILHSKDRNISLDAQGGGSTINFREAYSNIEDFFTAIVFSRLSYADPIVWEEIFDLSDIGHLKNRFFWPRWNIKAEGSIEPDAFFEFEKVNIIIEAKRYDGGGQSKGQIEKEMDRYLKIYKNDKDKDWFLFSIGGAGEHINLDKYTKHYKSFSWQHIFEKVSRLDASKMNPHMKEDLLLGFDLHGIREKLFLKDLCSETLSRFQNINYDSASAILSRTVGDIKHWRGLQALAESNPSIEYKKHIKEIIWINH